VILWIKELKPLGNKMPMITIKPKFCLATHLATPATREQISRMKKGRPFKGSKKQTVGDVAVENAVPENRE